MLLRLSKATSEMSSMVRMGKLEEETVNLPGS